MNDAIDQIFLGPAGVAPTPDNICSAALRW